MKEYKVQYQSNLDSVWCDAATLTKRESKEYIKNLPPQTLKDFNYRVIEQKIIYQSNKSK